MIADYNLVLSDAQAITNATAASTNYIDTLAAGDAITPGARVQFLVDTAATTADGGTVNFKLQTAIDSAFTSPVDLLASGAIAAATLTAGYVVMDAVIPTKCLRYVRAYYVLANNLTAGKFDARIVLDTDKTLDKQL